MLPLSSALHALEEPERYSRAHDLFQLLDPSSKGTAPYFAIEKVPRGCWAVSRRTACPNAQSATVKTLVTTDIQIVTDGQSQTCRLLEV